MNSYQFQQRQEQINFESRSQCVERVCSDLLSNIEEYHEIYSSLQELQMMISQLEVKQEKGQHQSYFQNDDDLIDYQLAEKREIEIRLNEALKVNISQKEILKEVLLKLCDENKPQIQDMELLMRQQQLEMLSLLQINQDQMTKIQVLEKELQTYKSNQLMSSKQSFKSQTSILQKTSNSSSVMKPQPENPFVTISQEQNKLQPPNMQFLKTIDLLENLKVQQQQNLANFQQQSIQQQRDQQRLHTSYENNPLSSQESVVLHIDQMRREKENDPGSPVISQSSRTLARNLGKNMPNNKQNYFSEMLIID